MNKSFDEIISEDRRLLQNPYAHLNGEGGYDALIVSNSSEIKNDPIVSSPEFIRGYSLRKRKGRNNICYSFDEIEQIAKNLQNLMWKHRKNICFPVVPSNPVDILSPALALKSIGYDYYLS
jgi:hypothetical protein